MFELNLFIISSDRVSSDIWSMFTMFFWTFWTAKFWVNGISLEVQESLRFHYKYLQLCVEDERKAYGFGTT